MGCGGSSGDSKPYDGVCRGSWEEGATVLVFKFMRGGKGLSEAGTFVDDFLRDCDTLLRLVTPTGPSVFSFSATGHVKPRSFPRLAIPTPHVNVVLYPEQSFPISRHCPQYGLLRSHGAFRFWHMKQSSAAPAVVVLLRRFLIVGLVSRPMSASGLIHAIVMMARYRTWIVSKCQTVFLARRGYSQPLKYRSCQVVVVRETQGLAFVQECRRRGGQTVFLDEEDNFLRFGVLGDTSDVRRHGTEWGILTLNVSS